MARLPPKPELDWSDDGTPRASRFDDVYFSRSGGLAESDTVFLGGCGLPERWRDRGRFAVCELGFGAGLNVLALWRAWKRTRQPHAILHISSLEAYPLARDDAARALRQFPDVATFAERLLRHWPPRAYGPQRFWAPDEGICFTLHVGDAEAILADMEGRFDAWFLDGFAPARNPQMWSERLIGHVARLSAPNATLATFTVAADVRRRLTEAGFAVEKKPGFGKKRERLEARFQAGVERAGERGLPYPYRRVNPRRVAVLGAGIAGAACAHALAKRNVETVVIDAAPHAASAASGNPAGLVAPRMDRGGGAIAELFLAAYLHAARAYAELGDDVFVACGVEERAQPRASEALADLLADPPLPEDWLSALPGGAALHRHAGLLRPRAAVEAMLANATLMTETQVDALERSGDGWVVRANGGRAVLKADAVVIACGAALRRFEAASFLPIQLSRGQIEWGAGASPARAVTQGGYVAPFDGGVLFGATFDAVEGDAPPAADAESRRRNLEALERLSPEIAATVDRASLNSRASLRATTNDRLPIAGSAPDAPAWIETFAGLAHGRIDAAAPPAHTGVYLCGGLGARGLTLAPLLGERIASEMFGEPQMLSRAALDAIHPARFLYRKLRRGG